MRKLVLVALFTAAAFAGSANASRSIIGGSGIPITQAPWTVYLYQASGACSGAILDATHVVTAGHCVFDANGVAIVPSALTVYAGISEAQGQLGVGGDTAWQMSTASAIRVHPGYSYSENANPDDVAVVTLSTSLTFGDSVQAVSLPAAGSTYPAGASTVVAGFGYDAPGTADGLLNEINLTVDRLGDCGGLNQIIPDYDATSLCASSPGGATCSGDSGGGLVSSGTLIGIVQAGPTGCAPGSHTIFAYIDSPEILDFIEGNDHPPTAPRESDGEYATIAWLSSVLEVGVTLSCDPGSMTGSPTYSYTFTNATSGQVIQQGPKSELVTTKALQGRKVGCAVSATNAGGTTFEPSGITPAIKGATMPLVVKPGAKPQTTAKPKVKKVTSVKPATPKGTLPKTKSGSTSAGGTKSATAGSAAGIAATTLLGELTELHAKGITVDCATPGQLRKLAGTTAGPQPTGYAAPHGKTLYVSATSVCKTLAVFNPKRETLANGTLEALLVLSREYGTALGLKTGPAVECYAAKSTWKWVRRSTFGEVIDTRVEGYLLDNTHQPAAYALAPSCKL